MRKSRLLLVVAGLFAGMVATNRAFTFDAPETHSSGSDTYNYVAIAQAVPHLPTTRFDYHHAQRVTVGYAIGLLHLALPLSLYRVFQLATLLTIALTATMLALMLLRAGVHPSIVCAVDAIYLFNPYATRLLVAFPALVDQAVFFAGVTVIVWAIVEERWGLLVAGATIAALARQTTMTLIPALLLLAIWRRRWSPVIAVAVAVAIYFGTGVIAKSFSMPSINASTLTGLFHDLGRVPAKEFAKYAADCTLPLALAVLLLLFLRQARFPLHDSRYAITLLAALGILGSPVLMGPTILENNGARLAALALPPLLTVIALLLNERGHPLVTSPWFAAGVALCAFVGSLHHIYSAAGTSRRLFGVLTLLSLAGTAVMSVAARLLRPRAA